MTKDELGKTTGEVEKDNLKGSKCIAESFEDGNFRYFNADGSPMQIEVPSDKYDAAVKAIEDRIKIGKTTGEVEKDNLNGSKIAGTIYGNVSNASTLYGQDKFSTPRGHGFAAEQANHLHDKIVNMDFFGQEKVALVGDDNVKNGADRLVNGVHIQTKYCNSGSKCIAECFEDGNFRYFNTDGSPMQIEVPSDKYDAAVKAMEDRIKKGQVNGVTDPAEAKNIVRKGKFTYAQAKNIAKAGTVESLTFDAVNGIIVSTSSFGISATITFVQEMWDGKDFHSALKSGVDSGIKVGGTTFMTSVISAQVSKAGLNSALVGSSEAFVRMMGPKTAAYIANAFRSGNNIYGAAAMKSAAKMLRSNVITATVSFAVSSSGDVIKIFQRRISGKQLFKNLSATGASIAAGTAGWVAGAAKGAAIGSFIPGVGNAAGAVIGGLVGSFTAGTVAEKTTKAVLGMFIEDDAVAMVKIIETQFVAMADEYLLNNKESEEVVESLRKELDGKKLQEMFASGNREQFASDLLIKHIEGVTKNRKQIIMPSDEKLEAVALECIEEILEQSEKNVDESIS